MPLYDLGQASIYYVSNMGVNYIFITPESEEL